MCGIAGYFGTRVPDDSRIRTTLALMGRRGPDAAGSVCLASRDGWTALLLNTRLAIVDLDPRSDQPFTRDGCTITLNGEIYNFPEMRAEAEARGAGFATTSDTEVLIEAVASEGTLGALERAEGMWALALFDSRDGSLTLSRDRFGEKPLFVREDVSGVWFGSEPKLIASLSGVRAEPDLAQVRRFLVNGYKSLYKGSHTFFRGLREIRPGTAVRYAPGGERTEQRYWAPRYAPDESITYEDAVSGVRSRVLDAVRLRLRADVPLAFCLSGGMDSNALVAVAKREHGYDVHGFTIVTGDPRYDEEALVDLAVERLRLRHTKVPTQRTGTLARLREMVRYHDAPVLTIADYVKFLLMERIHRAGYKVALTGAAADEIFSGYYDHHLWYLAETTGAPREGHLAGWREHVARYVRNPFLKDPDRFARDPTFRDHIFLGSDTFASYLCEPFAEPFAEERYTASPLRNRMLNEMFHEAIPVILHEDDLNAMYWSIENRSPYLDRRLFEFAYTVPTRHLMRDGYAKALLRDAMAGIVPDEVRREHRKVGFNAPIHELIDTHDAGTRAEILRDSPIFGVVRREAMLPILDKRELPNSESKFLFYFLSAKMFLEEFA